MARAAFSRHLLLHSTKGTTAIILFSIQSINAERGDRILGMVQYLWTHSKSIPHKTSCLAAVWQVKSIRETLKAVYRCVFLCMTHRRKATPQKAGGGGCTRMQTDDAEAGVSWAGLYS